MNKLQKNIYFAIIIIGVIGLSSIFPNGFYRLRFYTYLSNVLVIGFYTFLVLRNATLTSTLKKIKTGITLAITLTFLVYNILLLPKTTPEQFWHYRNFTLHYLVPILTIVDWIIFDKKTNYSLIEPIKWTVFPIIYCIFALITGAIFKIPIPNEKESPYPYFFLNGEKIGWHLVLLYIVLISLLYIVLGYVMRFLKNKKTAE